MSQAIEQIVNAYVRLDNRRALEDLWSHRQRLIFDLKARVTDYDLSRPIAQIDEEIGIIGAGIERLSRLAADDEPAAAPFSDELGSSGADS
jgi:hypothetical protein